MVSADGFVYELGDSNHGFTIQSISKPFVYGLALVDHGIDEVNKKVIYIYIYIYICIYRAVSKPFMGEGVRDSETKVPFIFFNLTIVSLGRS